MKITFKKIVCAKFINNKNTIINQIITNLRDFTNIIIITLIE